uniref:Uncharacterized protein n=1 Tax=Amphora coffeiformis TaxID=265554 RepID=A0A7S3P642_9STRA
MMTVVVFFTEKARERERGREEEEDHRRTEREDGERRGGGGSPTNGERRTRSTRARVIPHVPERAKRSFSRMPNGLFHRRHDERTFCKTLLLVETCGTWEKNLNSPGVPNKSCQHNDASSVFVRNINNNNNNNMKTTIIVNIILFFFEE